MNKDLIFWLNFDLIFWCFLTKAHFLLPSPHETNFFMQRRVLERKEKGPHEQRFKPGLHVFGIFFLVEMLQYYRYVDYTNQFVYIKKLHC